VFERAKTVYTLDRATTVIGPEINQPLLKTCYPSSLHMSGQEFETDENNFLDTILAF
jgi:hypothetical protein